jgi:autotransporter-associated beta strand protein
VGHQNTTGTLEFTGSTDSITDKKLQMGNQNSNGGNAGGAIILNNGSGSLTFNNPTFNTNVTTVTATRTLTLGGSYAGTNTILGVIQDNVAGTGKVALTKNADNSIWVLSGANTYSGATAVNGGMLVFAKKQAKSSATVTVAAAGSIGLGVSASDSAYYSSSELDSLYANTLSGFSMNAASGVGIDTTAGDFTYSSSITANRALTKLGANKLILSGTNTYSKATTIMAGTLALGATDVMPDASAIIIGTATLDAQTYSDTCGTLDVTGTAVINLTSGGNLAFADSSAVNSGTWAGTLNIIVGTLGSTSIRFGSTSSGLTAAQLGKITVNGEGAGKYYLNANGYLTTARGTVIQLF